MVDRVLALPEGTRLYLLAPVVRGRKGEYRKELAEFLQEGLPARQGRRRSSTRSPRCRRSTRSSPTTSTWWSTASWCARHRHAARGFARAGAQARRWPRDRRTRRRQAGRRREGQQAAQRDRRAADLLGEIRLPGLRLHHSGDRAAAVLVQQPVRRLPEMRRPRRRAAHRSPSWSSPTTTARCARRRDRAVGEVVDRPITPRRSQALAKHLQVHARHQVEGPAEEDAGRDPVRLRRGRDQLRPTTTACAPTRPRSRSRAWSPIWSGAGKETESDWAREEIAKYFTDVPCDACNGFRLKPEALCVKIGGLHIGEVAELSIKRAGEWFAALPKRPQQPSRTRSRVRMLKEIRDRLNFLVDVGLEYLTLRAPPARCPAARASASASPRRSARGLTGVLYVLDEPSIGLHQRDNARLLETLKRLRDLGNTVIVVEHDEDAIRTADHVLDIGPGAGIHGGKIVAQGTLDDIIATPDSITGKYLTGEMVIEPIPERRPCNARRTLKVVNARGNNLKNVTAEIPLGLFTCVTGVSGGGKSTLLVDTLYKAVARRLNGASRAPAPHDRHRRARAPRQGHRHRPVADRPHAALQPGDLHRRVHADPRMVRRPAGGEGARLRARPLLVQRQGRALRGLPGRRRHQDRDALSARRLRHLRRLQGQALQPRDARRRCSRASRSPTCST